jgi:hypothetical protein
MTTMTTMTTMTRDDPYLLVLFKGGSELRIGSQSNDLQELALVSAPFLFTG